MVDVLLVYPPVLEVPVNETSEELYSQLSHYCKKSDFFGLSSNVDNLVPPVALLSIATFLIKNSYSVSVLDLILEEYEGKNPYDILQKYLKKKNPWIVGISEMEMCLKPFAIKIVKIIKEYNSEIITVMGGVNADNESKDLLKNKDLDIIVHGEGEITFLELCKAIKTGRLLKKVEGISYKNRNNDIITTSSRGFLNPEDIPIPSREIYPLDRLYKLNNNLDLVYTSRGCPFNCLFCNAPSFWKRKWRGRIFKSIIEELKVIQDYGANKVHLWDLNFGTDKKWVRKLCKNIKDEGIDIRWDCELRIDDLQDEFLKIISSAGCCGAYCGIESAKQSILEETNKGYSVNILQKSLKKSIKNGVIIEGGYVIGLPGDNEYSIRETNKLAIKLFKEELSIPLHFLFVPFKGTDIGENPDKYGIKIVNKNPLHFHFIPPKPIASTKSISAKKVYELWLEGEKELIKVAKEKLYDLI